MTPYTGLLYCFLLWIFSPAAGKEFTVTCLTSEDCVLPCQFQSDGKGARIVWYKEDVMVSCTRYGNTNFVIGHHSQANEYKGRTGLYADQVLEGNATLLLRNVTPLDEGKYSCITITAPRVESCTISLVVKAPVRQVDVEFSGDSVTCRAEGIYPAPMLTWSTDPPSDARLLRNKTKTQKTRLGLYDIKSSLMLTENTIKQTYICCVSSDTNKKTIFLKHEASIRASLGGDVKVPCSFPHSDLQSFNLTWRFRRSDPILSLSVTDQVKSQVKVWDQWNPHISSGLSASSGLNLHGLKSEHQGAFTCEVRTPEETYVTQIDITLTEECKQNIYIPVIIGLIFLVFLSYGVLVLLVFKVRRLERDRGREEEEMNSLTT